MDPEKFGVALTGLVLLVTTFDLGAAFLMRTEREASGDARD